MPSIVDIMSMNDKKNTNILLKFDFLTERESKKLEDGYKWCKIPSNPEVVVSNNNITNNRAGGPKRSVESIVDGNGNLIGDEPDDEKDNFIPRSYYRCTAIGCNAKKKVERYMDDPTHVLTTSVGLHAHDLPLILPPPSRSFNLYNNSTVSPKLGKGSGVQKPILSDASAGARERMYANNTITSVNVRTDSDSYINDVGSIEDIGTGLLEDIVNLSSIAPHYQHHQPTSL
ncbi:WRKY transcription factor 68-like [Arachis stenosperma]|uniref:WRKY transcription factor 68-like n=1 Tax=Arachis stenosperma TaxID=217475 RepID=UPI0025AD2B79|nr:WRKY transcription factor 68-like [Arachis stenosperma]